jgi:hypothetical protein
MPILRLAYTTLFLIALLAIFELWSQVGGQSHLDLLPWYLKLVLGAGAAFSVVKAAAAAVAGERAWNRQTLRWAGIVLALLIGCGLASYYAHLYLEEDEQEEQNVSECGKSPSLDDLHRAHRLLPPELAVSLAGFAAVVDQRARDSRSVASGSASVRRLASA